MRNEMLDTALEYTERGWYIFPLQPNAKKPITEHGFEDASNDSAQVRRWWNQYPRANIGLGCGRSKITVVDLDVKGGKNGIEAWQQIRSSVGFNDDTLCSLTPSGGVHLLFESDATDMKNINGEVADGVDVKTAGGYIVLPGSTLANGTYRWDDEAVPIAPLPEKIHDLIVGASNGKHKHLDSGDGKISIGQRNDTLASIAGSLRRTGLDAAEMTAALMEINTNRCVPPLPDSEVIAIAKSIARYETDMVTILPQSEKGKAAVETEGKKEKKYYTTLEYITALRKLGYTFRMNTCNDMVEVNGVPISDSLRSKIRSQLRDAYFRQVHVAEDAWTASAYDNRYHPVRDYLNKLEWDGQDHISKLTGYFADKHGYFYQFIHRWLIGAVAKAFENGCQNRMLILDGPQGMGKSHFVRWLSSGTGRPELAIEGPIVPDNKDDKVRLMTTWLWEVGEVGSTTRRADREALKYFLSMQQVTVRKPYGRYDLVKPSLSSFVGTLNNVGGFLNDPTGYRRFMTVCLTEINWDYARDVDVNQLWAQAKALYDKGEPWELNPQEVQCADYVNRQYEVEDPLVDLIRKYFEVTNEVADAVATIEVREVLNQNGWRLRTPRGEAMAIAAAMLTLRVGKFDGSPRGYTGIRRKSVGI